MRQLNQFIILGTALMFLSMGSERAYSQTTTTFVRPGFFEPFFPGNFGGYPGYGGYGGYPGYGGSSPYYYYNYYNSPGYGGYGSSYGMTVIPGWGANTGDSDSMYNARVRPTIAPAVAVQANSPMLLVAAVPANKQTTIVVNVPNSQAKVWMDGTLMRQQGKLRRFSTPSLQADKQYTFDIRAQWTDAYGQTKRASKAITFGAGDLVNVMFGK